MKLNDRKEPVIFADASDLSAHSAKDNALVPWWQKQRAALLELAAEHSPSYVYNLETVRQAAQRLQHCHSLDQIFYAVKANDNLAIWDCLEQQGIGFECVSLAEVHAVQHRYPNLDPQRLLFTPNFAPRDEYATVSQSGHYLTLDSLYPLQQWPELFASRQLLLRLDLDTARGHHKHVHTAGNDSKFGIPLADLDELIALTQRLSAPVIGLHAHSGSGILQAEHWRDNAERLLSVCTVFPALRCLNLGGGLGIKERPEQQPLSLQQLDEQLSDIKQRCPELAFWMEPGRYLVAESGVLLAKVTQVKHKGDTCFIGIETGMNSLIRPSLYDAYHPIVNLTRLHEPATLTANIVGPICESGDTLGKNRLLPMTQEGDVLLIANAGAYGQVMSSNYNQRRPATAHVLY